jgi:macrolide transport system ATP-binding/permease protein
MRRHEITVRLSVGAGRWRLLRQLMTEGLLLSALGAAGGMVLASWCRNLIMLLFPPRPGVIVNLPAKIDWRVLALSAGVCLASTLFFALVPAIQATKVDLAAAMKSDSGGVVGGRGRAWVRSGLVLAQISLSFVLLVGAGLLLESLREMQGTSPGFSTKNVLTTSVDLISAGYDGPRIRNFQDQLTDRMQSLAGVESAAWARSTPFSYRPYSSSPIAVDGYIAEADEQPIIEYNEVAPGYLATMGIPLVSGREFTTADNENAAMVAIVNEAMALQYWRGADPIGKRVQANGRWMQVVGVAKNSKYRTLLEPPKPFLYVPMRQSSPGQNLEIRTALAPEAMASALLREIKALDANLAPGEVITMREQVDRMTWTQHAAVALLGIFGAIALLLAGVGLYGVMSYAVAQSTRELGLRMALGASGPDLLRLVMSQGFSLTLTGIAFGAAAAFGLTRLMGDLLYKVSPRDPRAFAEAVVVMTIAAAAACLFPAWRALRTDPVRALRG